jgi:hypothetical protein
VRDEVGDLRRGQRAVDVVREAASEVPEVKAERAPALVLRKLDLDPFAVR